MFSREQYDDILFIKLGEEFDFFKINENSIDIGAAYSLKLAGKELIKNGYSDYIFFSKKDSEFSEGKKFEKFN